MLIIFNVFFLMTSDVRSTKMKACMIRYSTLLNKSKRNKNLVKQKKTVSHCIKILGREQTQKKTTNTGIHMGLHLYGFC